MKITIEGNSRELAEIAKVLNSAATVEKKAGIPPLLTELVGEKFTGKENAPQMEAAEQGRTFASFKPAFEKCLKRVREANADA